MLATLVRGFARLTMIMCYLVFFSFETRGYKFTEYETSLVGSKEYPSYIRCIYRLHQIPLGDFNYVEQRCFETSIGTLIDQDSPTKTVELTEFEVFNPEGPKGGDGTSFNIDFKIFIKDVSKVTSARKKLLEIRKTPKIFETEFEKCLGKLDRTVPADFYVFVQTGPESLVNDPPDRNNLQLLIATIVCGLAGIGVVFSQAVRRYDYNPTLPPTAKVDNSKYEYVLEADDNEEKQQE